MLESVIVTLIGLWSLFYLVYRWLPFLWQPMAHKLVILFNKKQHHKIALFIEKRFLTASSGCGGGCSSCTDNCHTPTSLLDEPQPVKWRL